MVRVFLIKIKKKDCEKKYNEKINGKKVLIPF